MKLSELIRELESAIAVMKRWPDGEAGMAHAVVFVEPHSVDRLTAWRGDGDLCNERSRYSEFKNRLSPLVVAHVKTHCAGLSASKPIPRETFYDFSPLGLNADGTPKGGE